MKIIFTTTIFPLLVVSLLLRTSELVFGISTLSFFARPFYSTYSIACGPELMVNMWITTWIFFVITSLLTYLLIYFRKDRNFKHLFLFIIWLAVLFFLSYLLPTLTSREASNSNCRFYK